MSPKIKSIEIRAFRGIPELCIPLEGRGLIIGGENGTGKSSIVEALEFFFTGSVSHLEGTRGISSTRHAPHVHYGSDDVRVDITFDPGNIQLTRTFTSEPIPPEQLSAYFACGSRGGFILKRSQILEFIASRSADRFRALASIIGVDGLDEIELEMMRVRDDLAGEAQAKTDKVATLFQALSEDLGKPISTVDAVLPALNTLLRDAKLPEIKTLEEIQHHAEAMLSSVKSVASVESAAHLNLVLAQVRSPLFSNQITSDLQQLSELAKPLMDEKARLELKVSDLLTIGHELVEEEQLDLCPLCRQPIDRDKLLSKISERMKILQSLGEEAAKVRKSAAALTSVLEAAGACVSNIRTELTKDGIRIPSLDAVADSPSLQQGPLDVKKVGALEATLPLNDLINQIAQTESLWRSVAVEIEQEISRLGVTEEEKRLLELVRLIGGVKDKVEKLEEAAKVHTTLETMRAKAQAVFETFSETKKSKVTDIYNRIQGDIRKYYSFLHPGEAHTDITLRLSSSQRASTELRMKSFGRDDEDPRALSSEGHLDSLGLCIFLAFVKSFNSECSLVVLDDVVTTIDSGHRDRVCDLLFEEFKDSQLVITTNDGIWYIELAATQRSLGLDSAFLNVEIAAWCLENGPRIEKFMPRIERIEQRIQVNDEVGAGNEARQYLEWLLKHIALNSNASVPIANWQSGMVGDLESPVRKRMSEFIGDAAFIAQLDTAFSKLEKTVIFGNLLSHDNKLAEQISIGEVNDFFQAIRDIHRLASCPTCNELLIYVKNAQQYRCTNKRCKNPMTMLTK